MEEMEVGICFPSYKVLMESLDNFCLQTQSKFWKRDARTIAASRTIGVQKFLNPDIIYHEIKFSCIYGGMDFKSKGKNIRNRVPSLKISGCPAYLRFKASEDGDSLQLVAKNLNHNHELKLPEKKHKNTEPSAKRQKHIKMLEELENVEIEQQDEFADTERSSEAETLDYSELTEEDIKLNPESFMFRGLIAPVFTPFNNDTERSLNLDAIPAYAEHLLFSGINGVLVHGTTGEATAMTVEERKLVTDVWAQVCAQTQQHLMVGVGGAPLPDVIEMARHAEQKGANSLLCLPELYHKPKTCDELIRYLQIVSKAAPNTPLLYYHIPMLSDVNIHMGTFLNEVKDKIPTFCGIKFTSTALDEGLAAYKADGGKYTIFLGADHILAGACILGIDSGIATTVNIFPQFAQQVIESIKNGNIPQAQTAQEKLNAAIGVITKNGPWVPMMKEAMSFLTPINVGPVREPLPTPLPEHIQQMKLELKKLNL